MVVSKICCFHIFSAPTWGRYIIRFDSYFSTGLKLPPTGLAMFTAMDPNRFLSGGRDDIRTGDLDSHSHLWGLKRIEATYTTLLIFIPFTVTKCCIEFGGHSFDFIF